jgi:4-hydroxy-4-methyl-2-oxoglutarate aldolase
MNPTSLLDRLASLDTGTVSDALDFLGLPGATYGLSPLWDCPKIVGRASTIQLGPKADARPTVHLISPVIDAVTTDDRVLVIAGGAEGISCWGDILANAATAKRLRGSVIDGLSRDIEGSESVGYPVYGRGVTMISARNRVIQIDSGKPVQMAGVTAPPGQHGGCGACRPIGGGGHARQGIRGHRSPLAGLFHQEFDL